MASMMDLFVKINGDGSNFRRDIQKDQKEVNNFVRQMDNIHGTLANIKVDDAEAEKKVKDLQKNISEIRDKAARVDISTEEGRAKLTELKADLKGIRDKTADIKVNDTEAIFKIHNINAQLDALGQKNVTATVGVNQRGTAAGAGLLGAAIMSGIGLASPLAATAVGGAMGLASALTPATAGMAAFGAVATGVLSAVFKDSSKLTQAQQAYNKAVTSKQKQAALLKEKQAVAGLGAQQVKALNSLRSFESFWHQFTKQFDKPVTSMFVNGLKMVETLLNDMKPAITGTGQAFAILEKDASKALNDPFWKQFFNYIGTTAKPNILAFGHIIGNLAKAFAALMMAFNPTAQSMLSGLQNMTQEFANWAQNLSATQGFKDFISYVRQEGPKVLQLIGNLASLAINLLKDFAPVGAVMLNFLNSITKLANFILTNVPLMGTALGLFLTVFGGFKLLSGPVMAVVGVLGKLRDAMFVTEGEAIAFGGAMDFALGPIGWIAGALGVATLGIMAYSNSQKKATQTQQHFTKYKLKDVQASIKTQQANKSMIGQLAKLRGQSHLTNKEFEHYVGLQQKVQKATDPNKIKKYKDEMKKLQKESGLSNGKLNKMVSLNKHLANNLPNATGAIKKQGKAIAGTTDSMKKYNAQLQEMNLRKLKEVNLNDQTHLAGWIKERNTLEKKYNDGKKLEAKYSNIIATYTQKDYKNAVKKAQSRVDDLNIQKLQLKQEGQSTKEVDKKLQKENKILDAYKKGKKGVEGILHTQMKIDDATQKKIDKLKKEIKQADKAKKAYETQLLISSGINKNVAKTLVENKKMIPYLDKQIQKAKENLKKIEEQTPANQKNTQQYREAVQKAKDLLSKLEGVKSTVEGITGGASRMNRALGASIRKSVHVVYSSSGQVYSNMGAYRAIGHNAKGTNFWRGGLSWVGEKGTELGIYNGKMSLFGLNGPTIDNLPRGMEILPHNITNRLLSARVSPSVANMVQNTRPWGSLQQTQNVNYERLFEGAHFHVRDEHDIKKLAAELGPYLDFSMRGAR